jgi:ribosomal protein L37AE/L43A
MAVTSSSSKTANTIDLVAKLRKDYSDFKFVAGREEHWSPKRKTITYNPRQDKELLCFGVLHELAHAMLGHNTYHSDFELLKLESDAWELASDIGAKYGITINDEHIQNCLDTYRDWLHRRSSCPNCGTHVLQRDSACYECFNCHATWRVSSGRFVRPYRKIIK